MSHLSSSIKHDLDLSLIHKKEEMINKITAKDVQKLANKIFNTDNYIKFILMPEEK